MVNVVEALPQCRDDDNDGQREVPGQGFEERTGSGRDLLGYDRVLVLRVVEVRFDGTFVRVAAFDRVRREAEQGDDDPVDEESRCHEPELAFDRAHVDRISQCHPQFERVETSRRNARLESNRRGSVMTQRVVQ